MFLKEMEIRQRNVFLILIVYFAEMPIMCNNIVKDFDYSTTFSQLFIANDDDMTNHGTKIRIEKRLFYSWSFSRLNTTTSVTFEAFLGDPFYS